MYLCTFPVTDDIDSKVIKQVVYFIQQIKLYLLTYSVDYTRVCLVQRGRQ